MNDRDQLSLFGAPVKTFDAPLGMPEITESSAVFSSCGRHRYSLTRAWSAAARACWVLLNPSKAGAEKTDPTTTRIVGFSHSLQCGGFGLVNAFSLIATDPRELWAARWSDRVGLEADAHIRTALAECIGPVIVGWGRVEPPNISRQLTRDRIAQVLRMIVAAGRKPMCFGVNQDGSPKHPLYLAGGTRLVPFPMPATEDDE
jgi:hypothetical protein